MWVTKTPEELVWGYDEPLFELARMTLDNPPEYQRFGLFTDVSENFNINKCKKFEAYYLNNKVISHLMSKSCGIRIPLR